MSTMKSTMVPSSVLIMLHLCVSVSVSTAASQSGSKPHVWLIIADDLGFGDLGYTGSDIKTPEIDKLATGGVILGHYYVMHCCSPTRSALNTARYNIRYGLQTGVIPNNKRYGLNLDEKVSAQYMKELGYETHAIGKWHLGLWNWKYTPTFRGFDSFLGYYGGAEDYFKHTNSGIDFHLDIGANCGPGCSQTLFVDGGNYSTGIYAERGVEIVSNHDPATPLFLYTPFQSVHCPIEAPQSYVQPYMHLQPQRRVFAGMLSALDEAVGRIHAAFANRGMDANLLTIFSTDNGGPVGSVNGSPRGIGCATGSQNWPLRGGKGAYYQGGVRGTGWIHGPMLSQKIVGTTTYELMHVVDILPTIVEAAGGSAQSTAPHELDGVSQWKVLTEDASSARNDLLINIERESPTTAAHDPNGPPGACNGKAQYAVIQGRYKLLVGGGGQPNTWYHDGLPYNGSAPVPEGGCVVACSVPSPDGCPETPNVQIFDVIADEAERNNLFPNAKLFGELWAVLQKYNQSKYVRALSVTTPETPGCPFNDGKGALTPCNVTDDKDA